MDSKLIKDIIYENRKRKQLTQEQLADMLNVSNKTVSKWERGLSYPDILLIPKLAKILDISVSELFDTTDVQPEAISSYDNSLIVRYKNSALLSILIYIFAFVFPALAWAFQNITFVFVSLFVGIIMIIFSLINFILSSTKFNSHMQEKFFNKKYLNVLKTFSGVYTFLYFVPLMILPIFFDEGIDILVMTIVYIAFAVIILLIMLKLKVNFLKFRNIIFLSISFVLFIVGLLCMIQYGTLPYCLFYLISQIFNYVILFVSNKFKE